VLDYGIPVEPYLFVVDAHGDVFATFEGAIGADAIEGTFVTRPPVGPEQTGRWRVVRR
jgi:hypothetical protein